MPAIELFRGEIATLTVDAIVDPANPSLVPGGALRLARTYRNAFALAAQHGIRSIAFSAISCGLDSFPLEAAASIAVREARAASVDRVIFVLAEELEHVGVAREEHVLRGGTYIDREVHEIYVVRREVELAELTLQPGEVDEVMLVPFDAIRDVQPLVPHELQHRLLREFMAARSR